VPAEAVIDASGTWRTPNPLGADGLPALGEAAAADRIVYGIPDVLGAKRERYSGKRVLVVGSGHSAFNALLDLAELAEQEPGTELTWAVRRTQVGQLFGGEENDALPERGRLGTRTRQLVESGRARYVSLRIAEIRRADSGLLVIGEDGETVGPIDEIVCATGFRPDLSLTRELRLDLDPAVEAPSALAPLIDPNVHSCGSVPPHGAEELKHPEPDFYTVGMKSYGRAPTFLLLTGYEQVRSVAAAIAGDWAAARQVELVLPETGVCSTSSSSSEGASCCGTESTEVSTIAVARDALLLPVVDLAATPASARALATAAAYTAPQSVGVAAQQACCSMAEQSSCCGPAAKDACCDAPATATASPGCGCR
jgi:hypothetical protein